MDISKYLHEVADGKLQNQSHVLTQLQRLLNSLPDKSNPQELSEAFQLNMNDALLATYVGKSLPSESSALHCRFVLFSICRPFGDDYPQLGEE